MSIETTLFSAERKGQDAVTVPTRELRELILRIGALVRENDELYTQLTVARDLPPAEKSQ